MSSIGRAFSYDFNYLGWRNKKCPMQPQHEAQLANWRDRWIKNALSTEAMTDNDRRLATDAITAIYADVKLSPPRIAFVSSPIVGRSVAGFAAARFPVERTETPYELRMNAWQHPLGNLLRTTNHETWNRTEGNQDNSTWSALSGRLEPWLLLAVKRVISGEAWKSAQDATADNASWDAAWGAADGEIRAAAIAAMWKAMSTVTGNGTVSATQDAIQSEIGNMVTLADHFGIGAAGLQGVGKADRMIQGGNLCSGGVSFLSFFQDVIGLNIDYSKFTPWRTLAEVSGPRWVHEKFCIISDRPELLLLDDQRRPHAERGPFCRWRDGFEIYAWHGTTVPAAWLSGKKPSAAEALRLPNTEQRRAAFEIVGWNNILHELQASVVDADGDPQIGTLLRATIPGLGECFFLRVTCGTGREFALPVPPGLSTALEANAWTYGVDPKDFNVEVRT